MKTNLLLSFLLFLPLKKIKQPRLVEIVDSEDPSRRLEGTYITDSAAKTIDGFVVAWPSSHVSFLLY